MGFLKIRKLSFLSWLVGFIQNYFYIAIRPCIIAQFAKRGSIYKWIQRTPYVLKIKEIIYSPSWEVYLSVWWEHLRFEVLRLPQEVHFRLRRVVGDITSFKFKITCFTSHIWLWRKSLSPEIEFSGFETTLLEVVLMKILDVVRRSSCVVILPLI